MEIKLGKQKNTLLVTDPQEIVDPEYLLGAKRVSRGSSEWLVEENLINLKQLGLQLPKWASSNGECTLTTERLFDYQYRDVARMYNQKYLLNANPMGYGKTVEAVVAIKELKLRNALILAPKAVLPQWKREFETWWSEETRPEILVLTSKDTDKWTISRRQIVITNYEALQDKIRLQKLKALTWEVLVLDESHRIKNRKSQRFCNSLAIPSIRRFNLTGTPILKHVDDLWAQLYQLHWSYAGNSYWDFIDFFCNMEQGFGGRREPKGLSKDSEKVKLLNWLLSVVAIRNPNMNLTPGKRVSVVDIAMGKEQKEKYKVAKELIFAELPDELTIANAMAHLLRLRQLTSFPQKFFPDCPNAKFEWIKSILEDNPETKIVLMSTWTTPLKLLAEELNVFPFDDGGYMQLYHGGQSLEENQLAKQRFIDDPHIRILGGTIGSLGLGVDGLQEVCNTIVFLDRDWSPEVNAQAEDRLNRLGQSSVVNVYYLECVGTIDRHVSRINLSKAEDIRKALKEEN